jgi:hypothetical protein
MKKIFILKLKMENATTTMLVDDSLFNISMAENLENQTSINDYIYVYGATPICLVSFLLSLFNVIVLSDCQFKSENKLFVYLKFSSLFTSVDLFLGLLAPVYRLKAWHVSRSLTAKILLNYVAKYVQNVLEKSELLCTLLAAHSCLKLIQQNRHLTTCGSQPYVCVGVAFVTLAITTSHQIFYSYIIADYYPTQQATFYRTVKTRFSDSKVYNVIEIASFSLNNGLFLIILTLLNAMIVRKVQLNLDNKMKMTKAASGEKNKRTRAKLLRMVFFDCGNTIVCHLAIVLYFILFNTQPAGFRASGIVWSAVYFSFGLKFFILYYFNKRFRFSVKKKISKLGMFSSRRPGSDLPLTDH